ncbi:protein IN CHLOROPLAST ATPASE BIOGENESIS, chloroplastic isoform X2 [Hevea brasiliensis]|uniref:protein IN CHLOROPLAST ATPASE BIOGENESIS, chloroplastic isoform X2 n=1 Tax=Hevea brasiliensis TaxID=3981 RepID=UPI002600BCBB|nr:protein IN CHLOROPLAST ATPASE BIOGENESIS, chloroplastic isoform X2 [Hevea brasiliensis]
MKIGAFGVLHTTPPTTAVSLRHVRPRIRCFSSSGHVSFIKDVAATQPHEHLHYLLKILQTRGETIISPGSRQGLIPLVIPLSENLSGSLTALLRWPTATPGMEMPVVEVRKHGVWLLAKNVDQYIHRTLVEEDANNICGSNGELYDASSEAGKKLYRKGDFAESQVASLDSYILKKVGLFPDVLERKVMHHFEQGDYVSAMVTGEFYTKKDLFPGFGRPFVFYAEILQKVRHTSEAKDAARVALKSPWWTLGCAYQVASIAQWEDEQIEYIKEKVTEEGRQEDLKKGKAPAQELGLKSERELLNVIRRLDLMILQGLSCMKIENRLGEEYASWFGSPLVLHSLVPLTSSCS